MTPDATLRDLLAAGPSRPVIDPRSVPCRFSTLKQFAESPLHYLHACQGGFAETGSMRLGSAADAMLYGAPIAVWDQPAKTGKGKAPRSGAAWDEFRRVNEGKVIVNAAEHRRAARLVAALKASPEAMRVLFGSPTNIHQRRIDWEWTGRAFRSTPDTFGTYHTVDLKCLRSAKPDEVMWQSRRMGYHAQAALYRRAINAAHGFTIRDSYLVVVENKEPHPVTVLRFTPDAIEAGDRACVAWNEARQICEASGEYPGYAQSIVDLDVPQRAGEILFDDDGDEPSESEAA